MPRIGEPAPEFTAVTTQGTIHFPNQYKDIGSSFSAIPPILLRFAPRSL
jgi:alkyl hydroperoxide reductase subunit AhpC